MIVHRLEVRDTAGFNDAFCSYLSLFIPPRPALLPRPGDFFFPLSRPGERANIQAFSIRELSPIPTPCLRKDTLKEPVEGGDGSKEKASWKLLKRRLRGACESEATSRRKGDKAANTL